MRKNSEICGTENISEKLRAVYLMADRNPNDEMINLFDDFF